MKLFFAESFKRDYRKLSQIIQKQTDKKLDFLLKNTNYPSLRLKKIKHHKDIWEISVTMNYRIILSVKSDIYTLLRIGSHDILHRI